jgi:hypothetical protein
MAQYSTKADAAVLRSQVVGDPLFTPTPASYFHPNNLARAGQFINIEQNLLSSSLLGKYRKYKAFITFLCIQAGTVPSKFE